ncbi:hypothetical protein V1511DRAFT_508516 [Dipodascopsis uninucleata]
MMFDDRFEGEERGATDARPSLLPALEARFPLKMTILCFVRVLQKEAAKKRGPIEQLIGQIVQVQRHLVDPFASGERYTSNSSFQTSRTSAVVLHSAIGVEEPPRSLSAAHNIDDYHSYGQLSNLEAIRGFGCGDFAFKLSFGNPTIDTQYSSNSTHWDQLPVNPANGPAAQNSSSVCKHQGAHYVKTQDMRLQMYKMPNGPESHHEQYYKSSYAGMLYFIRKVTIFEKIYCRLEQSWPNSN